MNTDNFNIINQLGNPSITTYNDVQTRALDSVRIGKFCGKNLETKNNVFIGNTAGFNSLNVENSIFLGYNAGENIVSGNKNIIIGYNYNTDINNSITIGNNYTGAESLSIGSENYNFGTNNVITGFYTSNFGNNIYSVGSNIIVNSANVYYHNGYKDTLLSNISFNSNYNFLYDGYSELYKNTFNSEINKDPIISLNFFEKHNIITDFLDAKLRKKCYIYQGICKILYNNDDIINTTPINIILNENEITNEMYNLTKINSFELPVSTVKRVSIPILTNLKTIIFINSNGYILNKDEYTIKYIITKKPLHGWFKNNILDNIDFDSTRHYYIPDVTKTFSIDTYGITPFLIINDEYILGQEFNYTFNRYNDANKNIDLFDTPNPDEIITFSKNIEFISSSITIDVIAFDCVYLQEYLINNLSNIGINEYSNIIVSFFQTPIYGFIADDNFNPIAATKLVNLDNIVYHNYDNTSTNNIDTFQVNFSYGYNYANKIENNLTININIINSNTIIFNDIYLFDNKNAENNIISTDYPTHVIDTNGFFNINNYFKEFKNKILNPDILETNILPYNIIVSAYCKLFLNYTTSIYNNRNFYSWFKSITVYIYNNKYICRNNNLLNDKGISLLLYNYQFLRYDIDSNIFKEPIKISFNVMPYVIFSSIKENIYNFNLTFYNDDKKIFSKLITNNDDDKLNFNVFTNIVNIINDPTLYDSNVNNIRLEFNLNLNIINNDDLTNYYTEFYFRNIIISNNLYNNNNFSVSIGKNINIEGNNNIGIGSNIFIIGDDSVVIGNNNSENPVYECVIVGKNNLKKNFANKSIIIGNDNTSEINNNQLIIGNNINNKFSFNIDNTICRNDKAIYLGTTGIPVAIGYNENDEINISNNCSLYIKNGFNIPNFSIVNKNNYSIKFEVSSNLSENITYTFPEIPTDFRRLMLSTNSNGDMEWIETDTLNIDRNINIPNIVCKNFEATSIIKGSGEKLSNVNISDKVTDDLIEGKSNLYFTIERANNAFYNNLSNINTDFIKEGKSNLYYTTTRNYESFINNISNITTDDIKVGISNLYYDKKLLSNSLQNLFSNYTTNNLKEGVSNLYFTDNRFIDKFNEKIIIKTTDDFIEGSNNLFFTENKANTKIQNFIKLISTDSIKEGSSNKYFSVLKLQSNIDSFFSFKTSDDIRQGISNIYFNELTINNIVNNTIKTKTTNDIYEGTSNLYFTQSRFNQLLSTKTTDDVIEGTSNFYFTSNRLIKFLSNISSDEIKEGKINLYYNDTYASNYFYNNLSNLNTDLLAEGNSNKFIVNNVYNDNLNINGNLTAKNIFINDFNILDIYSNSIINSQSNYARSYVNYTTACNVTINNSNQSLKMILNVSDNNNITFNHNAPPIIVVGSNVGFNNYTPRYNVDVYGITKSTYFIGDGSLLSNINLDNIIKGLSNNLIINKTLSGPITIDGDITYNNSIIKGDIIPYNNNFNKIGSISAYLNNIYSRNFTLKNTSIYDNDSNVSFSNIFTSSFCGIKVNNVKLFDNLNNSFCLIELSNNKINFNLNQININPSNLIDYNILYNQPFVNNSFNEIFTNKNVLFNNININEDLTIRNINISNIFFTSNVLSQQKFINSNSINDILKPYITSNVLNQQNFITNSINDILIPYITSNVLSQQKFINSNNISDILIPYISSNVLSGQNFISSNNILHILNGNFNNNTNNVYGINTTLVDFNTYTSTSTYIVTSGQYVDTHTYTYTKIYNDSELLIQTDFPYTISGFGTDTFASRIKITADSGEEYSQEHIQVFIGYAAGGGTRSTTLSPISHKTSLIGSRITITVQLRQLDSEDTIQTKSCLFIITEKKPTSKLIVNNYALEIDIPILTSNIYISSNQFTNIIEPYLTSNVLSNQKFINSNSISDVLIQYLTSNVLSSQKFINSNSITDVLIPYFTSNNLASQQFINSNAVRGIINNNVVGYNSTLVDLNTYISNSNYSVCSDIYTNTHTCTYTKFFSDSEILIQADFPYTISGAGTDSFSSRLEIKSDLSVENLEYSQEHKQIFIGYAAGGGTRSTTLSPIYYKTALAGSIITITVQLRQIDSDDSIDTPSCLFIITEKKPSSKLIFSSYLNESDIPRVTSNMYISSNQLTNILTLYQNYSNGAWGKLNNNIFYNDGNIGIGINNPAEKLHVNGNIIANGFITSAFSDIRLKSITSNIINAIDLISKLQGFKYKNNDLAKSLGFIDNNEYIGISAQDVKKIIPEIVSLAPFDIGDINNGVYKSITGNNYLTVQYDKLVPIIIEAIKELKKENEIIYKNIKYHKILLLLLIFHQIVYFFQSIQYFLF